MNEQPRVNAAMTAGWPELVAELDRWAETGQEAMLWWRDDDAAAATPQLRDLLALAGAMPLALAAIPALAGAALAGALADRPQVAVLQHGWRHANHAAGGKKSEYPEEREQDVVAAEIAGGRERLDRLFGKRALPVFVPPWNRFAGRFLPLLPECGIAALSAMDSRRAVSLPRGLRAIDAQIDLVAWHDGRGFIGEAAALGSLVGQLRARRCGVAAAGEPLGILTHHLVMERATAAFVARLTALTAAHRAVRWAAVADLL